MLNRWLVSEKLQFVLDQICALTLTRFTDSFFTEPDVHPGFVSRVGPRALRLLADYLRQRVTKFMRFGALRYNASSTLTPLVRFTLTSTSTLHFDSTALQSQFNPMPGRGVQWMVGE